MEIKIMVFSRIDKVPLWRILPASPEHVPPVAADMRAADRREVWASHRHTSEEALRASLDMSELAWTCLVEGVPAFMWGAGRKGSLLSFTGAPWLLGTDLFFKASRGLHREFLRQCPAYVERMQERFPRLENFVHAENSLSIRWLKWCGFTLEETPVKIHGEDFYLFRREKYV
jgi:RimJ/RimL family protein N-acetyltransferase